MPALTPPQSTSLVQRGFELLKDAANLTSGADPNYIRDAEPESLFEAIPLAIARQGCRRYAADPGNPTAARAARVERACRPYLDSLDYGEGPTLDLPFRGGQCPANNYRINWSWSAGSFNSGPQQTQRVGPLSFSRAGTGSEDCGPGGGTYNVFTVIDGTGSSPVSLAAGCNATVSGLSVTNLDAANDNCGNPPPEYTPPVPPITPDPPGPRPFVRAPDIDIDIDVEINIDGSINVDIGTGPITIDPFADPPPGDGEPGGGDGEPGGGPPPGDVGAPGDGGFAGPGGDAEGEAPPGTVLTGLRMLLGNRPASPSQYKAGIFRGSAYIFMGTSQGLDLNFAGQTLAESQFVFATKDFLTHWKVSANLGYTWAVTPFYREVEE